MTPEISVIFPAYNVEIYIAASIESILNQTFSNFELLIYDDASTDNTLEIIKGYSDKRIKLFTKEKNRGYTDSLISGINIATGKYIARMDSDDIADLTRFEKQFNFLESHPQYGIVGSNLKAMLPNNSSQIWEFPENDEDIKAFSISNSPFAHPAVMIRSDVLTSHNLNYDSNFEPCEDFYLWINLLKYTKGKNLKEPLINYRIHQQQTISRRKTQLIEISNKIRNIVFENNFNISLTPIQTALNYSYFNEIKPINSVDIENNNSWRKELLSIVRNSKDKNNYIDLIYKSWITHLKSLREFKPNYLFYLLDINLIKKSDLLFLLKFTGKSLISYKVKSR